MLKAFERTAGRKEFEKFLHRFVINQISIRVCDHLHDAIGTSAEHRPEQIAKDRLICHTIMQFLCPNGLGRGKRTIVCLEFLDDLRAGVHKIDNWRDGNESLQMCLEEL